MVPRAERCHGRHGCLVAVAGRCGQRRVACLQNDTEQLKRGPLQQMFDGSLSCGVVGSVG